MLEGSNNYALTVPVGVNRLGCLPNFSWSTCSMQHQENLLTGFRKLAGTWMRASVHSSLLVTLALLILGILIVSSLKPGFLELRSLALTLPVVWVVSLTVRIAAQHLAIGEDSLEFQTRLGPTGSLSTDYELVRPVQIMKYSLAGHSATLFLIVLGMVITASVQPQETTPKVAQGYGVTWATLLDIHGGWSSLAWASQILWVNLLIGTLNLLPTTPFDNRGLLYAFASLRRPTSEAAVLRSLASFNSHLASFFVGLGLAFLVFSLANGFDSLAWYAVTAVGVYLFVASRWERSRAEQLDIHCVPLGETVRPRQHRHQPLQQSLHQPLRQPRHDVSESTQEDEEFTSNSSLDSSSSLNSLVQPERKMHVSEAYLDEILRKLHREGTASLSIREQEALLTASQRLKEKHRAK